MSRVVISNNVSRVKMEKGDWAAGGVPPSGVRAEAVGTG